MIAQRSAYEHNHFLLELACYERWLRRRHGRLFGLLEADEDEVERYPISLRHIFVPMRLDTKDLADEEAGKGQALGAEQPLGQDAWDVLAEHSFAIISGRPGSGKSTLMQAIVLELCGERPSELRNKLYKDAPGVTVLPIVLRELENIDQIQDWRQLLDSWWALIERDANADNYPLSIPELRARLEQDSPERNYQVLLLLDGIDEVSSNAARERLGDMAEQIHDELGYRVIITGRPVGVQDLRITKSSNRLPIKLPHKLSDQPPAQTFYLQPLIGSQITLFIDKWLNARPDWRREKAHLQRSFNEALNSPRGEHLLKLVRRPIFLTLMALVHCAAKQMPDGRAQLYAKIIDLYLNRQEKHRRLRLSKGDGSLPNWRDPEKRAVLGYIAWRSQLQRSTRVEDEERQDSLVWRREELLAEIQQQLSSREYGRFSSIKVEDADDLLNYFLQPAGLLVEPAEQRLQFSHLSFQEYLCADFINTTLNKGNLRSAFEKHLLKDLGKPGWDEVGLLLLAILQAQDNESHLHAMAWLDPSVAAQAQLLVSALSGGELGFRAEENAADLADWAPLALACCLLHPGKYWGLDLKHNPQIRTPSLDLLEQLFEMEPSACMNYLGKRITEHPPWDMDKHDIKRIVKSINKRWRNLKRYNAWDVIFEDEAYDHVIARFIDERQCDAKKGDDWDFIFGDQEAHTHALLKLTSSSSWLKMDTDDPWQPIAKAGWQERLAVWLQQVVSTRGEILWQRDRDRSLKITKTASELDALIPSTGILYRATLERLPLDCLLLQGETHVGFIVSFWPNQIKVLLALCAIETPPVRHRLSISLYQALLLTEICGTGRAFTELSFSRSQSVPRSPWCPRSLTLSRSRSVSRSLSLSHLLSRSEPISMEAQLSRHMLRSLLNDDYFCSTVATDIKQALELTVHLLDDKDTNNSKLKPLALALESYCYRWAALDWFREQSEDVGLAQRRGIKDKQPLPAELGLFDAEGMPLPTPQRANVERLLEWLEDDDSVIAFGAADATTEELEIIRADLEILRNQPWSPANFVRAILADWPAHQPTMDCSLAAADAELGKQSELLIINN